MIDIPVIEKVLGGASKLDQHFVEKEEEERMRAVADELRRRT